MKKSTILFVTIAITTFSSCDKDEPETPTIPNEEEVITTLTYTLTNSATGATATFKFEDLDGDGGNDPVITVDSLEANQQYSGAISLLNELETPAGDITEEVEEEADEHQMFYIASSEYLSTTYTDMDDDGNPIGIETQLNTGDLGTGTLTIILRHEPNKFAEGVSEGDITNAGGETDIEVVFDVVVQ